jgi:hypothetical protein
MRTPDFSAAARDAVGEEPIAAGGRQFCFDDDSVNEKQRIFVMPNTK